MFHILITEETPPVAMTATAVADGITRVERLSLRVDALDLPAITRLLVTPPRKPRADRGTTRKPKEGL